MKEDLWLTRLDGQPLEDVSLIVRWGAMNAFGARSFRLFVSHPQGDLSTRPLLLGLQHWGPRPGHNWVEVAQVTPLLEFPGGRSWRLTREREGKLFRLLVEALPPGGHIMVEYDSPYREATARALERGLPEEETPLGRLLLEAGCSRVRDWYIPEGGREGPRKLQGFKPFRNPGDDL